MANYNNRDIFILGTGEVAENLINEMKDFINILGVISLQNIKENDSIFGYPLYSYQKIRKKKLNGLIVDCTAYHYEKSYTEEMLTFDGYKVEEDFIDYVNYRANILNKSIMIISGFCHTDDIYRGLIKLPIIANNYLLYCFSYDVESMNKYNSRVLNRLIKKCDIYIYNYNEGDRLNFTKSDLPKTCKIICVPIVRFYGIWPQINTNHHYYDNPYYVRPVGFYDGAFIGGDIEINKRIDLGMKWEEIYEEISAVDFYSDSEIRSRLNLAMRQMEYSEYFGTLHITSFIKENYTKERLFKDYRHIADPITIEYIRQICDILDLEIDESYIKAYVDENIHEYSEMPVYPAVAKTLELEWVDDDTKYCVRSYNEVKYVTFKEYVQWYCAYSCAVKTMKENW